MGCCSVTSQVLWVWTSVALVTLQLPDALSSQVYLNSLSVHSIRRIPAIEGAASIYFQCAEEYHCCVHALAIQQWPTVQIPADEGQLYLPKVQTQDVQYNWIDEELALVSVTPSSCKACAFYEDRKFPLRKDDLLGSQFQVCEVDFAETGRASKSQEGQFDASFSCQGCKAPPPAPPAPTAPVVPPSSKHQGLSYGQSVALIVTSTVLSCTLVGALAVAGYRWHKARQKAQAEVAFEAALQDSGLGLDDAFEQDTEAFHQSLLHPSAWYKLKDGPSDTAP